MDQQEYNLQIKLRRYENAVKRQQYMSDFCRLTFNFYVKVTGWVCASVAALVSYSSKYENGGNNLIAKKDFNSLLEGSGYIVSILGVLSIFQIMFCLFRWYGYRRKEKELTNHEVIVEWWAWLFESGYSFAIALSIFFYWKAINVFLASQS